MEGASEEKKGDKIPLRKDDKELQEKVKANVEKATQMKQNAKTDEQRLKAVSMLEEAKERSKKEAAVRFKIKHQYVNTPSADQLDSRILTYAEQIRKIEVDIRNRDENKEVALGTSKINYMDPRISVAWCKRCDVPIDKVFAKTLRDKFNWAMAVPPDWKFE